MPSTMVTVGSTVRLPLVTDAEEVTCAVGAVRTALLSGSRRAAASSAHAAGESAGTSGSGIGSMCTLISGPAGSGRSTAGGTTVKSSAATLFACDSGSTTASAATRRATPAVGAVIDCALSSGDAVRARSLLRVAAPRLAPGLARRAEGWFPAAEDAESAASAPRAPRSEVSAEATPPA